VALGLGVPRGDCALALGLEVALGLGGGVSVPGESSAVGEAVGPGVALGLRTATMSGVPREGCASPTGGCALGDGSTPAAGCVAVKMAAAAAGGVGLASARPPPRVRRVKMPAAAKASTTRARMAKVDRRLPGPGLAANCVADGRLAAMADMSEGGSGFCRGGGPATAAGIGGSWAGGGVAGLRDVAGTGTVVLGSGDRRSAASRASARAAPLG
jgi:hypothetical protein